MQKVSEKQEHWLESCIDMISGLVRANISNGQQVAYSAYIYVLVPDVCPHTTTYVSSYYYGCVLIVLYIQRPAAVKRPADI